MPSLTLAEKSSLIGPLDYKILKTLYREAETHEWVRYSELSSITGLEDKELQVSLLKLYNLRLVSKNRVLGELAYRISFSGLDVLAIKQLYVNNVLKKLGIIIGEGKESSVYLGYNFNDEPIVIKFHRVGRRSYRHIKRKRSVSKNDWIGITIENAKKEYNALTCLKNNFANVPKPLGYAYNAVTMEYIDGVELYKTKVDNPNQILNEILGTIRIAYTNCNLIHGDLSEYNILVKDSQLFIIDWPQWSNDEIFLLRDLSNILRYFKKNYGIESDIDKVLEYVKGKL